MNKNIAIIVVSAVVAFAGLYVFLSKPDTERSELEIKPRGDKAEQAESPPAVRHPVPDASASGEMSGSLPEPLPKLASSDESFLKALKDIAGQNLEGFVFVKDMIRRFVATIDNLPREKLPQKYATTKPVAGEFSVTQVDVNSYQLDSANYSRYNLHVGFFESLDTGKLLSVYVRYYPLFQEAYADLGYPDGYFNDRLVEVIDHLIAAPEIQEPVMLTRPSVYYKFANPELETLSAGHKIMIRLGPDNAQKVKFVLRELRRELTTLANMAERR